MATRFRAAGFPAADVQVLVPPGKPTKGNLVVRYRGRGGAGAPKPILLLAHLDVVAANRARLAARPVHAARGERLLPRPRHGGRQGDGVDLRRQPAALQAGRLACPTATSSSRSRPTRRAATRTAPSGWSTKHTTLIDAAYAINEGGGGTLDGRRQAALPLDPGGGEGLRELHAHGAQPRRPLERAAPRQRDLRARRRRSRGSRSYQFPVALNEMTRAFFEQTAKVETRARWPRRCGRSSPTRTTAAAAATLSRDPRYASMLRTTCVATRLAGGHAYNALPQTRDGERELPHRADVERRGGARRRSTRVDRRHGHQDRRSRVGRAARRSASRRARSMPALLTAATDSRRQMWGDIPVIPTMSTGATDGRFLRAAGIPTYGVSGFFCVPGETNAHGRDEKLSCKSFYEGLEFLDQLCHGGLRGRCSREGRRYAVILAEPYLASSFSPQAGIRSCRRVLSRLFRLGTRLKRGLRE